MSVALADLHLHSTASDGKNDPKDVIRLASEKGLKAVSLTDHDTVNGLAEARIAASEHGIEFISGVELSTIFRNRECHILGYGFNDNDEQLSRVFRRQYEARVYRAKAIIAELNKLGFEIDFDEVWAESNNAPVSRVHIARVMISKGYCATHQEVFMKYLGDDAPAYVPFEFISSEDGINAIHEAGGVAILAHPSRNYLYEDLKELMDYELDGFEYIHPSHNYTSQLKYSNHAKTRGLLITGGSDFHGYLNKDFVNLGLVAIHMEYVRMLQQKIEARASKVELT